MAIFLSPFCTRGHAELCPCSFNAMLRAHRAGDIVPLGEHTSVCLRIAMGSKPCGRLIAVATSNRPLCPHGVQKRVQFSKHTPALIGVTTVLLANRAFASCQNGGQCLDENGENDEFTFYPEKQGLCSSDPEKNDENDDMAVSHGQRHGLPKQDFWLPDLRGRVLQVTRTPQTRVATKNVGTFPRKQSGNRQ